MNTIITAICVTSIVLLSACSSSHNPRWSNQFYSMFHAERDLTAIERDIARADYEYHYDGDDRVVTAGRAPQPHDDVILSARSSFRPSEKRDSSGFVVVQLHKLAQIDSVQSKVDRINMYFFARGADRVLVTGYRGSGRRVYSDKNKAQQVAASDAIPFVVR